MLICYTEKTSKARKDCTCSLCGDTIRKGHRYILYSGRDTDIGWFTEKYHPTCQRIINEYLRDEQEDQYDREEITDWLSQRKCHFCDRYITDDSECDIADDPIICPRIRKEFRNDIRTEDMDQVGD